MQNVQAESTNGDDANTSQNGLAKKKLTLSFEDYKNLSNMLILHMRNEENKLQTSDSDTDGMHLSDIVNWYLEQIAEQIETEDELIERKTLIEKVIDRLIYHDKVIIPLRSTGLSSQPTETDASDPLLVVHPNYIIE